MWAAVLHRRHEIGILRFLGASRIFVIAMVLAEAAVIGLAGASFAILVSQSVLIGLNLLSAPAMPYSIGFGWCLAACGIVIGAAIAGSTIPSAIAARRDVLDMLERD